MPESDVRRLLWSAASEGAVAVPPNGAARARRTARSRTAARVAGVVAAVAVIVATVPVALSLASDDMALQPRPAAPTTDEPSTSPSTLPVTSTSPPTTRPVATTSTEPTTAATSAGSTTSQPTPPGTDADADARGLPAGAGSLDGYVSLVESGSDPEGTSVSLDPFWPVDACRDQVGITGTNLPDGVLDYYRVTHGLGDGGAQVVVVVLPDDRSAGTLLTGLEDQILRCGDPATAPKDSSGGGTWQIVGRGGYGDEALLVHVDYYPTPEGVAAGLSPDVWEQRDLVLTRTGNVVLLWESYAMATTAGHEHDLMIGVRDRAAEELTHLEAHLS
jgi:hypothetical protein